MSSNTSLQPDVAKWVTACMGEATLNDQTKRAFRFLEEALELAQACGVVREEVDALTSYVFNRPIGEIHQEVAGSGVTLLALATAYGLDFNEEITRELARVWEPAAFERIRAKAAAAPKGPLPQ